MSEVKTPWAAHMGDVPMHLEYFGGSMFQALEQVAQAYPGSVALILWASPPPIKR